MTKPKPDETKEVSSLKIRFCKTAFAKAVKKNKEAESDRYWKAIKEVREGICKWLQEEIDHFISFSSPTCGSSYPTHYVVYGRSDLNDLAVKTSARNITELLAKQMEIEFNHKRPPPQYMNQENVLVVIFFDPIKGTITCHDSDYLSLIGNRYRTQSLWGSGPENPLTRRKRKEIR